MKEADIWKLFRKYVKRVGVEAASSELGYCKGYIELMYYGCRKLPNSVIEFFGYERKTVLRKKKA